MTNTSCLMLITSVLSFVVGIAGCKMSAGQSAVVGANHRSSVFDNSPSIGMAGLPLPESTGATAVPLTTLGKGDDLEQLIGNAAGVVLVDFYADWCGPCRKQSGVLHDLEQSASHTNASIIKVDIDQHEELAQRFEVTSLPTLLLFKDGQIVDRQTGLADQQTVAALLTQ